MGKRLALLLATLVAAGCAGAEQGPAFDSMTAAEHRAWAAYENRLADEKFASARGELNEASPTGGIDAPYTSGYSWFTREWDPYYPEYYTVDPRPRVRGEKDGDSAAEHRARAERHLRRAQRMEEEAAAARAAAAAESRRYR